MVETCTINFSYFFIGRTFFSLFFIGRSKHHVIPLSIDCALTLCTGECATISATGAYSYTWFPGYITAPNITICPAVTSKYTVVGYSAESCARVKWILVTVDICNEIDDKKTIEDKDIKVYPNPCNGEFKIESILDLEATLSTETGIKLIRKRFEKGKIDLDINFLKTGIYFLEIETTKGKRNYKIINVE